MPWTAWASCALWAATVYDVVLSAVYGGSSLLTVLAALFAGGAGLHFVQAKRDWKGRRIDVAAIDVAASDVAAVLRKGTADTDEIVIVNRIGRVVARAHGDPAKLARVRTALEAARPRLPAADATARLFLAIALPAATATVLGIVSYADRSRAFALAGLLLAVWPILLTFRRRSLEIAVDGLSFVSVTGARRFLAFVDIAAIDGDGETLLVTRTDGEEERFTFAYEGSVDEVLRRWSAHRQRRDAPHRVAVEITDEGHDPYRVRVADVDSLAAAVLDSAEPRQVRVRAAAKLARVDGEDAARVRVEIEEHIADPEVRDAIRGASDSAASSKG